MFDASSYNATIGHPGISFLLFLLTGTLPSDPKKQESPTRVRRNLDFIGAIDQWSHKSAGTQRRGYVRDAELFKDHAGAGLL
jgi:hypothetical protein